MDLALFASTSPGRLVSISGSDARRGDWSHRAFIPDPLITHDPPLQPAAYRAVATARAALASLDSTARQLPDPTLFREPTLRREAQSTSALEGTYAPLDAVLEADAESPSTIEMAEILNYIRMATHGFGWITERRPIGVSFLCDLQSILMRGTVLQASAGQLRDIQVVIGLREDASQSLPDVQRARFVPSPPGLELDSALRDLTDWLATDLSGAVEPVVAAAMAHYQFETLHPFRDGNGRLGRFLIVAQLMQQRLLSEPTLTVSPWFEARRHMYYDRLLGVSTRGDWSAYVQFFSEGIAAAADLTRRQLLALSAVQAELQEVIRRSPLRAERALALVDLAAARPTFTIAQAEQILGVSNQRARKLVTQLMDLGIIEVLEPKAYKRRYYAPAVLRVLVAQEIS